VALRLDRDVGMCWGETQVFRHLVRGPQPPVGDGLYVFALQPRA